jgi:hypothetical protein
MKWLSFCYLVLLISITACNNNEPERGTITNSENDVDAVRNFIRSALDGKWKDARRFMLMDSTNAQLLDAYEDNYRMHMEPEDKRGYREASVILYDTRHVNDSVSIVQYANSFKKQKDSVKAVRIDGRWLIDLKYSFPQTDTAQDVH